MFIRLLKAIAELVVVSAKLTYVYMFYPSSKTVERAEKVLDPVYDEHIYSSGESDISDEALKDEWIQGNVETDYTFDPIVVESTKKILEES
jgi:hypothetical protein